jgi:hypothetical protein
MEQELCLLESALQGRGGPPVVLRRTEDGDHVGVLHAASLVGVGRSPHGNARCGHDSHHGKEEDEEGGENRMPTKEAHQAWNVARPPDGLTSRWPGAAG